MIRVQVDDREPQCAVLAAIRQEVGVEVLVERLPIGDYLIDDSLLFERKTLMDLTRSIKDGRLFAQGLRLAGSPRRCALILEGRSKDLAGSQMRREAIQGALVTLTLFLGIPLLRSMEPAETARLMLFAARQGRRFANCAYPRKGRRPRGKARLQGHILQGLPGIGPTRAKRLLEYFGSVEAVVTADPGELAEVPGVGRATVESIRWAVREPSGPVRPDEDLWFPI